MKRFMDRFNQAPLLYKEEEFEVSFVSEGEFTATKYADALGLELGTTIDDYLPIFDDLMANIYAEGDVARQVLSLPVGAEIHCRVKTVACVVDAFAICCEEPPRRSAINGLLITEILKAPNQNKETPMHITNTELLTKFRAAPKLYAGEQLNIEFTTNGRFTAANIAEDMGLELGATVSGYVQLGCGFFEYLYAENEAARALLELPNERTYIRARAKTIYGIYQEDRFDDDEPVRKTLSKGLLITDIDSIGD